MKCSPIEWEGCFTAFHLMHAILYCVFVAPTETLNLDVAVNEYIYYLSNRIEKSLVACIGILEASIAGGEYAANYD